MVAGASNQTFGVQPYTVTTGATDSAPNSAAPAATRYRRLGKLAPGSVPQLTLFCLTGTTITAVPWVYDDGQQLWVQLHAAMTATPTAPALAVTPRIDGALIFWQLTANTGCTVYGFIYG